MGFEHISGLRVLDTGAMASGASGISNAQMQFVTEWPITVKKVVGVASTNSAGTVIRMRWVVNGTVRGVGTATLTTGAGAKSFAFNNLTWTAPANSVPALMQGVVAATAGTPVRYFVYYHHGHARG
jgi:hypothetical protein